jgi:hypothetical protein
MVRTELFSPGFARVKLEAAIPAPPHPREILRIKNRVSGFWRACSASSGPAGISRALPYRENMGK